MRMTRTFLTKLAAAAVFVAAILAIVLYLVPSATVEACCLQVRTVKGGESELAPAVGYTYTPTAGTNLWSDPTRWSPSYPGETIASADTVTINDGGQVLID